MVDTENYLIDICLSQKMLIIHLLEKNVTHLIVERKQMHMHVCRPSEKRYDHPITANNCVLLRHKY